MSADNSRENIFEITTDVVLTDFSGKTYTLTGKNEEVSVQTIIIYESLESPYLIAEMSVVDNGVNLIGTIPITGMEKITFGIKTPYYTGSEYKYTFHISAIRNRTAGGKIQTYTIDMISYEGLQNEGLRIAKTFSDYGHKIVEDILKNNFKTDKDLIDAESCKYKSKFVPRGQRPFDLIYSMLGKCIPYGSSTSSSTSKSSIPTTGGSQNKGQSDVNVSETISGSSGYFFWESYDGYHFKSIDSLCAGAVKQTYAYQLGKTDSGNDPGKTIIEYSYTDEIDVMKKMRYGTYSSMMVFFNPSTGQYEEYLFDIDKSYSTMQHLGKDEKIPDGPKQLSKYPTRIMTQFLDHETYYTGSDVASPDPKDNTKTSGTPFPDYKKYYTAQSISRKLLLSNQVLKVTVHGNLNIRAGDKVTIVLPNFSVSAERKKEQYDKQHSGDYLVKEITYEFYRQKNSQSNVTVSNMTLVRDSFGSFTLNI